MLLILCSAVDALHKSTSVAPTFGFTFSITPRYPHHVHATAPSCGDVLQVRVAGRLHESMAANGLFRLRVGVGVARTRALFIVHGSG